MATLITRCGYAPVNGLQMYYEVLGEPGSVAPPLLLLHGALGTLDMFGELLPSLATTRQVIAVEQQGHGRTADIDRPLRYEQMADDTAALLGHLDIDNVDVFGFSMGGGIAWQLAIRRPSLVRKLVAGSSSYTRAHGYAAAVGNLAATFSPEMFKAPRSKRTTSGSPPTRMHSRHSSSRCNNSQRKPRMCLPRSSRQSRLQR